MGILQLLASYGGGTMSGPAGALLHLNSGYTDESGKLWTGAGSVYIDTALKKFGAGSLSVDGTNSYLTTPSHADFAFGTGDFTVGVFVRQSSIQSGDRSLFCVAVSSGFSFGLQGGKPFAGPNSISYGQVAAGAISTGSFVWVACSREAGTMYLSVDGTIVKSGADTYNYVQGVAGIGAASSDGYATRTSYLAAKLDEVYLNKGNALYTASYTPPTAEFAYP